MYSTVQYTELGRVIYIAVVTNAGVLREVWEWQRREWSENEQVGVDKMVESEGVEVGGMELKW